MTSDGAGISSWPLCSWFLGFGSKQESISLAVQPLNYITGFSGSPLCQMDSRVRLLSFCNQCLIKSLSLSLFNLIPTSPPVLFLWRILTKICTHVLNHLIPPLCPLLISICITLLWILLAFLYESAYITKWLICLFLFHSVLRYKRVVANYCACCTVPCIILEKFILIYLAAPGLSCSMQDL